MLNQKIKRALISVSDKTNLIEFTKNLVDLGIEIISTGGTYKFLLQNNIPAVEVSDITSFPEILDGRVKTLHPKIHGGILAKRDEESHLEQIEKHGINLIDLVCVNLYPFEATINKTNVELIEAIENIDIGGPSMIRAGAKNYKHVTILTDNNDYLQVVDEIAMLGDTSQATKLYLAQKAFNHTAYYDGVISNYLANMQNKNDSVSFPSEFTIPVKLAKKLRYGENGHQESAFYKDSGVIDGLVASFRQLQGKELSYNNLSDSDTAWESVRQFKTPTCVIIKHANPCSVAMGHDTLSSYKKALAGDPVSSFGGIIAFNCKVDYATIVEILKQFVEVLIAPEYTAEALQLLQIKPNIRVLKIPITNCHNRLDYKRIGGGLLVQTPESKEIDFSEFKVVTKLVPTASQNMDLLFAWQVARMVKSNAIVLVKNGQTIGIGAGQMSRIDSTKIALAKAREFGFDVVDSVCASDAFFPFRDNVDLLAEAGVKAIIQPGGSIKDNEVFTASNDLGIIMVLTGYRTFRH